MTIGEQSPGATLTSKEKLDIARQLAKLGVDIIEAGFPIASPDDFDAVRRIAMDVGRSVDADGYVPVICGLSRANNKCESLMCKIRTYASTRAASQVPCLQCALPCSWTAVNWQMVLQGLALPEL